jgi:hypothetical protein
MIIMNRIALLITIFAAIMLAHTPLTGETYEQHGLCPAAIIIRDHSFSTFDRVTKAIEHSGAKGISSFPPEVVFGFFPAGFGMDDLPGLDVILAESADDPAVTDLGPIERSVVHSLFNRKRILERGIPADAGPINDRVLRVPPEVIERTKYTGPRKASLAELQVERGIQQNSEFLIGSVLMNIIFPESQMGSEDWTDEEIAAALSGIAVGMTEYQQHALWTDLSFTYNYKDFVRIPVSREPIEGDMNTDPIWISEALSHLGYESDINVFRQAHDLNNETRQQFGTDWVFIAFIADASVNGCWQGPIGGYVAYAWGGGPYCVIPFPACGYGDALGFSKVIIHEMSHIFWVLDEYSGAEQGCNFKAGYLAYSNRNTLYNPCEEVVPCIMQSGFQASPLPVCYYTRGQVGLGAVDYYWGAVPEIYNVAPGAMFNNKTGANLDTIFTMPYEAVIDVWNDAVPNLNPAQSEDQRIDYAPNLRGGYYWVNGGIESEVDEPLGGWTSDNRVTQLFPGLEPGRSDLCFRFENTVGLTKELAKSVYYIGIKYFFTELEPEEGQINVGWATSGEVFGAVFDVLREDITGGGGEEVLATVVEPEQASSTRRFYTYRDGDVESAHQYRYRVVGRFEIYVGGELREFTVPTSSIYEISLIPRGGDLVSYLLPNPTPGGTSITVDIPKSYYDPAGGQENAAASATMQSPSLVEVLTPVDIGVYNVMGQRIATVYNGNLFGTTRTFQWNGVGRYGRPVAPGVYFMRVQAGDRVSTKKVVIVR